MLFRSQGKTIKEIAEELGVSKTAVRKQIANLGLQTSLRKSGNQFAIEKEQETLIKSAFSQKQSQTKIANQVSDFANQSETSLRLVSMLQHELEIKNKELEIKNKQIEELNARLAEVTSALTAAQQTAQAAQALHAGMMQQQLKSGEAAPAEPETLEQFIARGWARWGAEPYTDLMAITEATLARDDVDHTRTAAMGGSFGGYSSGGGHK